MKNIDIELIFKAFEAVKNKCEQHSICLKEDSLKPILYNSFLEVGIPITHIVPERHGDFVIGQNAALFPKGDLELNPREFIIEVKTQIYNFDSKFPFLGEKESCWADSVLQLEKRIQEKSGKGIFVVYIFHPKNEHKFVQKPINVISVLTTQFPSIEFKFFILETPVSIKV